MVLILIEIWQFWLKENVRFWHKADQCAELGPIRARSGHCLAMGYEASHVYECNKSTY